MPKTKDNSRFTIENENPFMDIELLQLQSMY